MLPPPADVNPITDDEEDNEEDDEDDDSIGEEDDVEYLGENLDQQQAETIEIVDGDDQEFEVNDHDDENDADDESDEDSDDDEEQEEQQVRRYPTRERKKAERLTIDDPNQKSYSYRVQDGAIHIDPSVLESSREDLKITSKDLFKMKPEKDRMSLKAQESTGVRFKVPKTAGVTQDALTFVCADALGIGDWHMPSQGTGLVSDGIVTHVLGVVLAEQYSINKGIKLFGDRARE